VSEPLVCQDCGKVGGDVEEGLCPFALDVYDDEVEVVLCDDCRYERAMDV